MKINAKEKYSKKALIHILEHLYDNDYFYHKRVSWEDWVIAKADVEHAVSKCSKEEQANIRLLNINDYLFNSIYNSVNGISIL